jgi:hypothetical protein
MSREPGQKAAPMSCDEALVALALESPSDARHHLDRCPRCSADARAARTLAGRLAAYDVPAPGQGQLARTLASAAPLLARRAQQARARRQRLAPPIAVAVGLLPLVVLADAWLVRVVHALLAPLLPPVLSAYLVVSFGSLLALLLALACGAVPLVAARQTNALRALEEVHV